MMEAAINSTLAACQLASCCSVGRQFIGHKHGRSEALFLMRTPSNRSDSTIEASKQAAGRRQSDKFRALL